MTATELKQKLEVEGRLSEALLDYAGQWVAVSGDSVIAHAPTLIELLDQSTEAESVFQVVEDKEAVCFF